MAITTKELAEICNVSRGTIDRALNNRPGINSLTRERIKQIATEYNYRPHLIASSLSRGRSMSIGVILFDLKNQYFSQISNVISIEAFNKGYFTYIAVSEKNLEMEIQLLNNLASRRVDGIIILPITQGKDFVRELKSLEIPIVTIVNHLPGIPHVHIDDFKAAYDSTCYISQAGYKRICFICTPLRKKGSFENKLNITSQELRVQGFKHFMEANPEFQYDILTQRNYHEQAALMAKKKGGKIAFLCSSDVHAIELLQAFEKDGVAVPGDAGIMGFDNLDILAYIKPRLTTTSTSIELVAQKAISTLLKIIQGEKVPSRTYVSHSICPGATL